MVRITKNGRELYIPYSAYVQDYKDIGWVIIKEPKSVKVVEKVEEEKKEEVKQVADINVGDIKEEIHFEVKPDKTTSKRNRTGGKK